MEKQFGVNKNPKHKKIDRRRSFNICSDIETCFDFV